MLLLPIPVGSTKLNYGAVRRTTRVIVRFKEPNKEEAAKSSAALDLIPRQRNWEPIMQHPLLEQAEHDLERYCGALQNEADKERCWRVHDYLHNQHEQFSHGCKRELDEEGQPGKSCQNLAKLEDMVRQVDGTKKELIKTVSVMEKLSKRQTSSGSPLLSRDAIELTEKQAASEELQRKARQLFRDVDRNKDGRLDVGEFRDCMKLLSKELAGDEVMQIFICLDAHGFISEEEFIDVVMAEKERMEHPDSDAELLRKLHVHPSWWSECPASVDSL